MRNADVANVLKDYRSFTGARDVPGGRFLAPDDVSIVELDPPRHGAIRATLLATGIARAALARAEPAIETICRSLARALPSPEAELMADFVRPAVRSGMAEVIGLPEEDREQVYDWVEEMRRAGGTSSPATRRQALSGPRRMFEAYLAEQIEIRRGAAEPRDDALTLLLDRSLDREELFLIMRTLVQAGIGATPRLIGNVLHELIRVPERYRQVRDDRSLVPAAVEETLRFSSPVQLAKRVCLAETEIQGIRIHRGDQIVVNIASANRDEAAHENPDVFDLRRLHPTNHLAFGRGRHRCPGAPAARRVAVIAVNALLDRIPQPRLAPGFRYQAVSYAANGPRRLDVVID